MPQLSITQLPQAQALTGAESVPVVQNGVTVQTTTGAVAGAGALNYPFLTVSQTAGLTQSRYLGTNSGLTLTDNGAQGTLQINLIGAAQSLNSSGTGIQVKDGANTVTARSIGVGAGLGITNADGVSGNPTVSLGTALQQLVALTGTGMLALQAGSPAKVSILGVTSQTSITNGDGSSDVIVGLAGNAVLPGTGSVTLPQGTTGQRLSNLGSIRYNTTSAVFEGYTNTGWNSFSLAGGVTSFSAGTTGFSPSTDTTGAVTLSGVLNAANGGTGASTLTGYVYGNGTGLMTASTTIPNAGLANSAVTYNGVSVALGASGTITAANPFDLTIGTGLSGTTYNGSAAVTIAIDSTVATLTGTQTLTNKSISGSANTLTNIANASLTNSAVTIGTTAIALGASSLTLGGLTSVAVTQDPTSALQLATKQYVDTIAVTSVHYHTPVYVESPDTVGNLNATYNQPGGAGVGVGATLTNAGTQVALTIDGVLMTVGKRVLIYNQTNGVQNGVYTVTVVGDGSTNWVLTRATDADTYSPISSSGLGGGDAFFVQAGATGAGETYVCSNTGVIVFGTTPITFVQVSSAPVYSAGTGLTLTGTTFSLTNPVVTGLGGTGLASYTTGDMLYYSTGTALSKLGIGSNTYIMTSNGAAPQWSNPTGITVGTATNATNTTNTGITANSTNATNYLTFVSATSGNLPQLVNSAITCNPSTGQITGGIAGGAF